MSRLHEVLAAEGTVNAASEKLIGETNEKFNKFTEFFTGSLRTLKRVADSPEDRAIEEAARKEKILPTTVGETLDYTFKFFTNTLNLKLQKHCTNQVAKADILLDGAAIMQDVPVDFLLDLEAYLPRLRDMFLKMPTLDPSKEWVAERVGVWKTKTPVTAAQTEKKMYPVELSPATDKHPAQVKEATKDITVGVFSDLLFSGAATSQQKADVLALVDKLIVATKEARMRANSVEVVTPTSNASEIVKRLMEAVTRTA